MKHILFVLSASLFVTAANASSLDWKRRWLAAGELVSIEHDEGLTADEIISLSREFDGVNLTVNCLGYLPSECLAIARTGANVIIRVTNDETYSHLTVGKILEQVPVTRVTLVTAGIDGYELRNTFAPTGVKMRVRLTVNVDASDIRAILHNAPVPERITVNPSGLTLEETQEFKDLGAVISRHY